MVANARLHRPELELGYTIGKSRSPDRLFPKSNGVVLGGTSGNLGLGCGVNGFALMAKSFALLIVAMGKIGKL
jgi:hypothetical protein